MNSVIRSLAGTVACLSVCVAVGLSAVHGGEQLKTTGRPPALFLGEELEYKVSYSFFSIGTIRFKVTDRFERNGRTVYKAQTIIDSNPSLSWLTELHIRFYTEIDQDGFSYWWVADDSSSRGIDYRMFQFDYPNKRMFFSKGRLLSSGERAQVSVDTVAVSGPAEDGLALFYYARERVHQKAEEHVPTFIDNKEVSTYINFLNERTDTDISAVDYDIDVIHFDGRADFVGVFGLTGGFEGWFSNDDARVPITARMKVILGSIKVELAKWKRGDWAPPKYEK
jgi:hypothetical protein